MLPAVRREHDPQRDWVATWAITIGQRSLATDALGSDLRGPSLLRTAGTGRSRKLEVQSSTRSRRIQRVLECGTQSRFGCQRTANQPCPGISTPEYPPARKRHCVAHSKKSRSVAEAGVAHASWSAATESSESPLSMVAFVVLRFGGSVRWPSQSGDFVPTRRDHQHSKSAGAPHRLRRETAKPWSAPRSGAFGPWGILRGVGIPWRSLLAGRAHPKRDCVPHSKTRSILRGHSAVSARSVEFLDFLSEFFLALLLVELILALRFAEHARQTLGFVVLVDRGDFRCR